MSTQSDHHYTCFQSIQAMFIPIMGATTVGFISLLFQQIATGAATTNSGLDFAMMVLGPLFLMVTLLFVYPVIHLISKILRSHGSFRGIFIRTQWWNTGTFILFVAIVTFNNFYIVYSFLEEIVLNIPVPASHSRNLPVLAQILLSMLGLVWFMWVIAISVVMAHHYQFSKIRGCLTMALSHLIFSVVFFVLYIGLIFQIAWWMGYFL